MKKISVAILIAAGLFFASVNAQQVSEFQREAINNSIDVFVMCYAFYMVGKHRMENDGKANLIKSFEQKANAAFTTAVGFGKLIGINRKEVQDVTEMELLGTGYFVGFNPNNFEILTKKYGKVCESLITNPEAVINYWSNQISKTSEKNATQNSN